MPYVSRSLASSMAYTREPRRTSATGSSRPAPCSQAVAPNGADASFCTHGAVLSTIGMGLGFNETLMASLADYGMGHYAYLEHLATLGDILQQDLHDAQ